MTTAPQPDGPQTDEAGLVVLDRDECFRLLQQAPIGRVVFTAGALPAVLPLNFAVDESPSATPRRAGIVIKTGSDTRLATGAAGSIVAFEADEVDPGTLTGWSVVVTGHLTVVRDPAEVARLSELGLRSWITAPRDRYLRIAAEMVTGRRLTAGVSALRG